MATVAVRLQPSGRTLEVPLGRSLKDALFLQGIEFPCGGEGRCRGCRVRVLAGDAPPHPDDLNGFSAGEVAAGWRLACRLRAQPGLVLEVAQWEAQILSDESPFAMTPREGVGIAVDLGTTTCVAQWVDLSTGVVLDVQSALNVQARHGADLMSRIEFAVREGGGGVLRDLVRNQVGDLLRQLAGDTGATSASVREVVIVGNTVMHHLFSGLPVESLAQSPFRPADPGAQTFAPGELGWTGMPWVADARVTFLPCLGGFVGSDILAGILASGLHEAGAPGVLVDLGTNGEIVVGAADRMLCASTAAGPAFEGARIQRGMRAVTGAITAVSAAADGGMECAVLGGGEARGICGSGLVDAVAVALDLGRIQPGGRLVTGPGLHLAAGVELVQRDIRELQLAKGAIAAGIRLLLRQWGADLASIDRIHLAGAFGNYINRASARRIGLLPLGPDWVRPAGNTALMGARMALFREPGADLEYRALRDRVRHVELNEDPGFMDAYVAEMAFPAH